MSCCAARGHFGEEMVWRRQAALCLGSLGSSIVLPGTAPPRTLLKYRPRPLPVPTRKRQPRSGQLRLSSSQLPIVDAARCSTAVAAILSQARRRHRHIEVFGGVWRQGTEFFDTVPDSREDFPSRVPVGSELASPQIISDLVLLQQRRQLTARDAATLVQCHLLQYLIRCSCITRGSFHTRLAACLGDLPPSQ
jgi:hypothetical protein